MENDLLKAAFPFSLLNPLTKVMRTNAKKKHVNVRLCVTILVRRDGIRGRSKHEVGIGGTRLMSAGLYWIER